MTGVQTCALPIYEATDLVKEYTYKIDEIISNRVTDGSNDSLKSRTGELRRNIRPRFRGAGSFETLQASVYTTSKYAPIHETGGTIKAKNAFKHLAGGPFLTIPSDDNKTGVGVTKKTVREVFSEGGFTIPIRASKAEWMIMLQGKPMYWLVDEVDIPARLGFEDTFKDEVPNLLQDLSELMGEHAERLLR